MFCLFVLKFLAIITLLINPNTPKILCHVYLYTSCGAISGTYDVQNLSVVRISDGILISGHYIDNSEAEGFLAIVYNTRDPDQYPPQYHLIPRHNESSPKGQKIHYRLTELGAGEQSVSVFVVEKNRLPFSRVATRPKSILIPNSSSKLNEWLTSWSMTCYMCIVHDNHCTYMM